MAKKTETFDFSEDIYSATDSSSIENQEVEIPVDFDSFEIAPPVESVGESAAPPQKAQAVKRSRIKEEKPPIVFNNGEPLSFAVKKVIKECAFIIICLAVVSGFFLGKQFYIAKTTDDGIGTLSLSSQYKKARAVKNLKSAPQIESDGYSCIEVVSKFFGKSIDEKKMRETYDGRDITGEASGLETELSRALVGMTVTRRENISDYTLMTQIYESLKNGKPVIVACTDTNGGSMSYAVVSSVNTAKEALGLVRPDGTVHSVKIDKFLSSTRFENFKSMSLFTHLGLAVGYYNINTAFFITDDKKS